MRAETDFCLGAEELAEKVFKGALEVGEGDIGADVESF